MSNDPISSSAPQHATFDRTRLADCAMPAARADVLAFLAQHGLAPAEWGVGTSKSAEDLLDELATGESRIVLYAGQLMRAVELVKIAVTTEHAGVRYRLVEDRQVFSSDDRVRRRPTAWAVWEKLTPGEEPLPGARRALGEELKLSGIDALEADEIGVTFEPAQDYPGLPTIAFAHAFQCCLPAALFRPSGFAEVGRSKTTYFHWTRIAAEMESRGKELFTLPLNLLREQRLRVAAEVHGLGVRSATSGFRGIQLAEALSVGRIGEALTAFDGSSGYVRGALYPVLFSKLGEDAEADCPLSEELGQIVEGLTEFANDKFLPGEMVVANHGVLNPPYGVQVALQVGRKRTELHIDTSAHEIVEVEWRERAAEVVAILTLELLRQQLSHGSSPQAGGVDPALLATAEVTHLGERNAKLCEALLPALRAAQARVVVGESFTFGKLAELLQSGDASLLERVYGWYAPEFKWAVGIPEELLADDRIATPETVMRGAEGLLQHVATEATVAIATSGWCNVRGGLPDHFSVAVVRVSDRARRVSQSLQFSVAATQGLECGFVRRAITRELGVTAAMRLLAAVFGCRDVEEQADRMLAEYARER